MTNIYFVRHAEPNYENHNDRLRELTGKGLRDRETVTEYLADKNIHAVLSSPYKRAVDTVKHFADGQGLEIELVEDFREQKVAGVWIEDFNAFAQRQWTDLDYRLEGGECLREVQRRNIAALIDVLHRYEGKNVVIGSHGTAVSTILRHFQPSFSYPDFRRLQPVMPLIVRLSFEGQTFHSADLFDPVLNRSL